MSISLPDPLPVPPPAGRIDATVALPGSKSITNRALVLAALANGTTLLTGALFSRDTRIMIAALRALGYDVHADEAAATIRVAGLSGEIPAARATLHLGNAGTAARFLPALLALRRGGEYRLECDAAMSARPMSGLFDALEAQGSCFTTIEDSAKARAFPCIQRTSGLRGGDIRVNATASSQILSALLMVAPLASASTPARVMLDGDTVSHPFVTMTVRMMAQFGRHAVPLQAEDGASAPRSAQIPVGYSFHSDAARGAYLAPAAGYAIEPDATAASYFFALPFATPAKISIRDFPMDSLQGDIAFLEILRKLGLQTELKTNPPNDLAVASPAARPLGGDFDFNAISDTFLTLAALAPLFSEPTTIRNIAHARKQETDRVLAMATELERLGQGVSPSAVELRADPTLGDITIYPDLTALRRLTKHEPILVRTYEDHRIAMSFGILALHRLHPDGHPWLHIQDPACTSKTFPNFFPLLLSLSQSCDASQIAAG